MEAEKHLVGFTDDGRPLVLAEHACEHWRAGEHPTLNSRTCWYCRYSDFRKTADALLEQSVCRCPHNRTAVFRGGKNETELQQGRNRYD